MAAAAKLFAITVALAAASSSEQELATQLAGNKINKTVDTTASDTAGLKIRLGINQTNQTNASKIVEELDHEGVLLAKSWRGWSTGGDKLWGSGRGMEDVNGGNVGYYNSGMDAARGHCGGSSCSLIVNPIHHRSIDQFHIHFPHYAGYGANLKSRLERRVCGKSGWHSGGLPCHGRAIYAKGWPRVFSLAMTGTRNLAHASVIAWPQACGGRGTIVELAFHCSIEHQIRGDYDPNYR